MKSPTDLIDQINHAGDSNYPPVSRFLCLSLSFYTQTQSCVTPPYSLPSSPRISPSHTHTHTFPSPSSTAHQEL